MGLELALDATAFCVLTKHGLHQRCTTIETQIARTNKKDPSIPQIETIVGMLDVTKAILRAIADFKVRHVGIKGYAHDAKWQVHQLGELAGVIKTQLWLTHRIVPEIIAPSSARKHVMGYGGRMSQEEVRKVVEEGLGIAVRNNREATAAVVARYMFDQVVVKERESVL